MMDSMLKNVGKATGMIISVGMAGQVLKATESIMPQTKRKKKKKCKQSMAYFNV